MTVANVNVNQILLKRGTTVRSLAYTGPGMNSPARIN